MPSGPARRALYGGLTDGGVGDGIDYRFCPQKFRLHRTLGHGFDEPYVKTVCIKK